jgi:hypothetical protein
MTQPETKLSAEILPAITRYFQNRIKLFRNQVGFGWFANGKPKRLKAGQVYRARGGEVVLMNARPYHCGLIKGSGDNIGWEEVTITQEMVGQKFARFVSLETKIPKTGRLSEEQKRWDKAVRDAGGRSVVARSVDEAVGGLEK